MLINKLKERIHSLFAQQAVYFVELLTDLTDVV